MAANPARIFKGGIAFCAGMLLMTILCYLVWHGFVYGTIYYANPMANHFEYVGYTEPGKWIGQGGQAVTVVAQVRDDASEGDPDQLKQGWSVPLLWALWSVFFAISLAVSVWCAMRPILAFQAVIFAVAMMVMAIACEVVWDNCLANRIYLNTDDGDGGGYISPGHWVGNDEGFPVITVPRVIPEHMSDRTNPDELKTGWTMTRLWVVWWMFFGTSLLVSYWCTTIQRRIRRYLGPRCNLKVAAVLPNGS
jgi:hypothetical protein